MKPNKSLSDDDSASSASEEQEPISRETKRQKTSSAVPPPLEIVPTGTTTNAVKNPRKIIVLLDQARLETVKTRKGNFELLNCDDHRG